MYRRVLVLALLAACSTTGRKASVDVDPAEEVVQAPTELRVQPTVWETAGSSVSPVLTLVEGPATRELAVAFEYVGDGRVTVPDEGRVDVGSDRIEYEGEFAARAVGQDARGAVQVTVTDAESGTLVSSCEWPVFLRESIVSDIATVRTAPMDDGHYFACYVAVKYDPLGFVAEAPADRDERVELVASVEEQGRFRPAAFVVRDLDPEVFQKLPQGFEEDARQRIFFVAVEEPSFPPVQRAYLKLVARVSGDEHTTFVPLPNR